MPLYRRLPKRGFNPIKKEKIAKLNLDNIIKFIEKKRINPEQKINIEILKNSKIVNKSYSKFKILGNVDLKVKLDIEADFISKSAKEIVEKAGGKITLKNSK